MRRSFCIAALAACAWLAGCSLFGTESGNPNADQGAVNAPGNPNPGVSMPTGTGNFGNGGSGGNVGVPAMPPGDGCGPLRSPACADAGQSDDDGGTADDDGGM